MVELKIAAKETVKITFGGNAGWEAHSWMLDDAWLSAHHQSIKNLQEESDGHMRERDQARANVAEANDNIQRANEIIGGLREELSDAEVRETKVRLALEEMRAGRTVDREAINKLAIDLADAREEIARLKGKTISDWEVRQRELYQEIQDLTKQRDDAWLMRAEAVAAGTPVYMIDQATCEKLKALADMPVAMTTVNVGNEWRPIETAPKDGTSIVIYNRNRGEFVGKFWQRGWIVTGGDPLEPTHWMPLPEPPK